MSTARHPSIPRTASTLRIALVLVATCVVGCFGDGVISTPSVGGGTTSGDGGTASSDRGTASGDRGAAPGDGGAAPGDGGATPGDGGAASTSDGGEPVAPDALTTGASDGPAGDVEPASTCSLDGQSRLVCDNAPNSDIHSQPSAGSPVVDVLRTAHSWFACWTTGEPHSGGSSVWYRTTGDDTGRSGYVPGSIIVAPSTFDPASAGLAECGSQPTTGPEYASALLALWGDRVTGNDVARQDLVAASQDQTINNSDTCGNTIKIDPALLKVLYQLTDRYDLIIWNIVTGHGCDQYFHPRGMASDLGGATDRSTGASTNFAPGTSGDDQNLDRSFVEYFASILPANAGLGQSECAGRSGATIPPDIHFFSDTCNHQHVQMDY
jgi:hypothetical protein